MSNGLDIPFDRVTYRDGQLLTARDMRDEEHRNDRLRRLHTRYLHDTWGIALGLEVRRSKDGRSVVVAPGYALDSEGRDLVLAESEPVPVPNVTGPTSLVLALAYQEDPAFRARFDLEGLCLSGGLDLRCERPIFSWEQPQDACFGPQVPLVHGVITNGAIQEKLDLRVRRNARPHVAPHVGWGLTERGKTGWRSWKEGGENLGLEVFVSTAEAGFTRPAYYFAALKGDFRNLEGQQLFPVNYWGAGSEPAFFSNPLGFILNAAQDGFTYRIAAVRPPFAMAITPQIAEKREWQVFWLGIEPVTGCEPVLDLARIFALSGYLTRGLEHFF